METRHTTNTHPTHGADLNRMEWISRFVEGAGVATRRDICDAIPGVGTRVAIAALVEDGFLSRLMKGHGGEWYHRSLLPYRANPFSPGDMALHVGNHLDARPVESVHGDTIRLRIGSLVTDPVPAANYTKVGG